MMISIKRVYDQATTDDGYRILVDRLWPRGIKKFDARIDEWWKDYAPSNELRTWFDHDIGRWEQFVSRYLCELDECESEMLRRVRENRSNRITLIYAARDEVHNNAAIMLRYIRSRID